MKDKKIFVSGGAGVIGLEMIPRLVARGGIVMVGDMKSRPVSFPQEVIYRQGDLNAMTSLEFGAFAPDVFIHLAAAFERSTESYEFWEENFWHNVRLSHHLMTLAKDSRSLKRVVFASSYLIYHPSLYQFEAPQAAAVSLNESAPVLPRNLTGMAKLAHELELKFLESYRGSQFSSVCARIYRGYGRNSRDVISRWVRMLISGEPITVYRPEGLFDYIYAADTAEGLIRLAANDTVRGIINLGTGRARRVSEVVDILRTHFPRMRVERADADIPFEASQADMSLYREKIGWQPQCDLERAIPEIIAYEERRVGEEAPKQPIPPRVLVSSASRKIPLIRAMQHAARCIHPNAEVFAGDLDPNALSSHIATHFWAMPRTTDEAIDDIVQGCRERGITAVLPTRDGELIFWAQHAAAFRAAGVEVIVSAPDGVQRCIDKLEFSHFGRREELPFIPSALFPDDLLADRYVVKERFGAGSRSIGINLDRVSAIDHARNLAQPIFQPYVEGVEISIDAWLDRHHQVKGLVMRRREKVVNGESQVTTTFRDVGLEAEATRVLERLSLRGPVVLQAMVDDANRIHVIECNPRFGGASTTSLAAGLNSLYWSLLEAGGADLTEYPFHRVTGEIRQVRIPTDLYFDGSDI